ncbi:MAG: hypothetical protein PHT34_03810 [Oscillospiraceae bacterium]|nr:hypothetical protein [Oscillospiraceae bacterium]
MGKKRIGTILGWIISILLLFTGIVCLFQNFLTGIFFLLAGLILLPPLYRAVKKKLPIRTWQKAAALAACLALAIAFMPKQSADDTTMAAVSGGPVQSSSAPSQSLRPSASPSLTSSPTPSLAPVPTPTLSTPPPAISASAASAKPASGSSVSGKKSGSSAKKPTPTKKASGNISSSAYQNAAAANNTKGITVYITPTGSKYHLANCRTLKKNKAATSLSAAKAQGYKPCGVCHPPV